MFGHLITPRFLRTNRRLSSLAALELSIDVLINNFGSAEAGRWSNTSSDDWHHLYDINVLSGVRLIQPLLEPMKQLPPLRRNT